MRKWELTQKLEEAKAKELRAVRDCDFYKVLYENSLRSMGAYHEEDVLALQQALNVALSLKSWHTVKYCPKCDTAIENRHYVEADKYLPQYLIWTCKCGYQMFTRTYGEPNA